MDEENRSLKELLQDSAKETGSIACMGLDPVVEALPSRYGDSGISAVQYFFEDLFDEMAKRGVLPGAFKPNQGFYVKHDNPFKGEFKGSLALNAVISMINERFAQIPIILDSKRGDIATSSANYAEEAFEVWGADAVTVAPYMGDDSILPFASYDREIGVYILNRTSNPGAANLQNLPVEFEGEKMPFYKAVSHNIARWANKHPGVGAVVGATSPDELKDIAGFYSKNPVPLLIPGVGSQGGSAEEVMRRLEKVGYDLNLVRINSSSELTHSWKKQKQPAPKDAVEVCIAKLYELNQQIGYDK